MAEKSTITGEAGIKVVTDLLFQGKTRKEIVKLITTSYKISAGAIDKWIKAAKPTVKERQQRAETIRVDQMEEALTEAVKNGLLSDIEIEAVLCRIISGGMQVQEIMQEGVILRDVTPFEMINAARTVYQKRGSNAPAKVAQTDAKGNDVRPPIHVTLNLG